MSAADIARTMAESLAAAGASAEDIIETMREALEASLALAKGAGGGPGQPSIEDILDIAETVARAMAEAGAAPETIAAGIF
jgi:hypothetical protein